MRFEDLKIGMSYSMAQSFTSDEVEAFSKLSMDVNPLHEKRKVLLETVCKDESSMVLIAGTALVKLP